MPKFNEILDASPTLALTDFAVGYRPGVTPTAIRFDLQSLADLISEDFVVTDTEASLKNIILANPDANVGYLAATGFVSNSGTVPMVNYDGTWDNGATVLKAVRVNIDDDSSGLLSRLQTWEVNSAEKAGVLKDGAIFSELGIWRTAAGSFNGTFLQGMAFQNSGMAFYSDAAGSGARVVANFGIGGAGAGLGASISNGIALYNDGSFGALDLFLEYAGAATLQLGRDHETAPIAQILKGCNATSGDNDGGDITISGGNAIGAGIKGAVILNGGNAVAYTSTALLQAAYDFGLVIPPLNSFSSVFGGVSTGEISLTLTSAALGASHSISVETAPTGTGVWTVATDGIDDGSTVAGITISGLIGDDTYDIRWRSYSPIVNKYSDYSPTETGTATS